MTRRILLVDDYPEIRKLLSWMLISRGGYQVTTAGNAEEAFRIIEEHYERVTSAGTRRLALDLLIVDLMMPGITGLELLRTLRDRYSALPRAMVVSAVADAAAIAEAVGLGAGDYVTKPVDRDILLNKVRSLLGDPSQAPFHWASVPEQTLLRVGSHTVIARSISECGLMVQAPPEASLNIGEVLPLEGAFFDELGLQAPVRGRVVRLVPLSPGNMAELTFVGLPQRDNARIRRFALIH